MILNTKLIFKTSLNSPDSRPHFILTTFLRFHYLKRRKKKACITRTLINSLIHSIPLLLISAGNDMTCNLVSLITSVLLSLTINSCLDLLSPVRVLVQAGINCLIHYLV